MYTVNPPGRQLPVARIHVVDVDIPIHETASRQNEIRKSERLGRWRDAEALGVCNIDMKLLKVRGNAIIPQLHSVLTAV